MREFNVIHAGVLLKVKADKRFSFYLIVMKVSHSDAHVTLTAGDIISEENYKFSPIKFVSLPYLKFFHVILSNMHATQRIFVYQTLKTMKEKRFLLS